MAAHGIGSSVATFDRGRNAPRYIRLSRSRLLEGCRKKQAPWFQTADLREESLSELSFAAGEILRFYEG
jgi:hypothetical protein